MKIAFYKGSGTFFDKLVRFWTRGPYSHCEIVFNSDVWFSSSPRDHGCRFKYIKQELGHWDFIDLDVTEEDKDKILQFCILENGKGYDWLWILFTQFLPLNIQERKRWGCSEFCTAALQKIRLLTDVKATHVHPNEMYKLLRSG